MGAPAFDAVVLAGGRARRLGGADKPMVEVGGIALLDRVLDACLGAGAAHMIVVGPERPITHTVTWVLEQPPGGGPAAAVAAALHACSQEWVGVFAADLPFLGAESIHSLWITSRARGTDHDGAITLDEDGREQWLAAIYRRDALIGAVAEICGTTGTVAGFPMRRLAGKLRLARTKVPTRALMDCDTWDDVDAARLIAAAGDVRDMSDAGDDDNGPRRD
jgi:molybdopterin-guanine dinucleotide biosynthesis protein A